MHPDRDFLAPGETAWAPPRPHERPPPRLPVEQALIQDLGLDALVGAMAGEDPVLAAVAMRAILTGADNASETVRYRQAILADFLDRPALLHGLYGAATDAIEGRKRHWWGLGARNPSHVLHSSVDLLEMYLGVLRRLRVLAEAHAGSVRSPGLRRLFETLGRELSDEYLALVRRHLAELRFPAGLLLSAGLGTRLQGTDYVLQEDPDKRPAWIRRLWRSGPTGLRFTLNPHDQRGPQILADLRDRAVNEVANALGQSAEHVLGFFENLRAELAFYVACVNLRERLAEIRAPTCFPEPQPRGSRRQRFSGLYDPTLALAMGRAPVGNAQDVDGKDLILITGANQGGKSSFLRAIGLAQLMLQAGLFVAAETFAGELCSGLFTHFKREEDPTMRHGKLDEELARLSQLADALVPDALVLFNESFAATNEREGSEIARQVVRALRERRIKVVFVTHLYDFAQGLAQRHDDRSLFLRAERRPDGTRTFRLSEAAPLQTSFGEDLFREVFQGQSGDRPAPQTPGGGDQRPS